MLSILAALLVLIALGALVGRRVPWTIDTAQLGTVSQQWLAEYRASHPS